MNMNYQKKNLSIIYQRKKIKLRIKIYPYSTNFCHKIMDRIASIRFLKDIFVRVTYVGNRYLVEGRVKNIAQREFALLVVAGLTKSVSVGNRLRIFKP